MEINEKNGYLLNDCFDLNRVSMDHGKLFSDNLQDIQEYLISYIIYWSVTLGLLMWGHKLRTLENKIIFVKYMIVGVFLQTTAHFVALAAYAAIETVMCENVGETKNLFFYG